MKTGKGHRGGRPGKTTWKKKQVQYTMAVCARCGREFRPKMAPSIPRVLLLLTSYPLRSPLGFVAAVFVIGGVISIGLLVGTALTDGDLSTETLSLSFLFTVVLVLAFRLLGGLLHSRVEVRYCPDCAIETRRPVLSILRRQ